MALNSSWFKFFKNFNKKYLFIFLFIFILDRLFKIFSFNGCFYFTCIDKGVNYGAAFGFLTGKYLFLIIVAFLILFFIILVYKNSNEKVKFALIFIFTGALSNLFDRIFIGGVVDYLKIFGSSAFNFADISNLIGVLLLVKFLIKEK